MGGGGGGGATEVCHVYNALSGIENSCIHFYILHVCMCVGMGHTILACAAVTRELIVPLYIRHNQSPFISIMRIYR